LAVGLREENVMHRILGSSFLRFFGKYSYCLYICHLPLIVFFTKFGLNSDHFVHKLHNQLLAILAVNAIAFAMSIAVALVSWNLYEKQWLKLKDLPILRREDTVTA
jgi:peptidoglycan/LPS O-acetylase OafA/YrhL